MTDSQSYDDSSCRQPIDLAAESFEEELRAGKSPSIDEYARRYPEIESEIRELFPTLKLMVQAAPDSDAHSLRKNWQSDEPPSVGDYQIVRKIGQGGMGVVYEAYQKSLARRVALKVLPQQISTDEKFVERFKREARASANLHHTNIVPVFEVGQDGDTLYYAMQYIEGRPLDDVMREIVRMEKDGSSAQPTAISEFVSDTEVGETSTATKSSYFHSVARLGAAVADALAYAHERSIIHRDVKPSNLILDTQGVIWLADFGLAKTDDSELTETGDFLGTARYMSPERFKGAADERGDIYALGVTLYELMTGQKAFASGDRLKLIDEIAYQDPTRPKDLKPGIPLDLETIVLKSMSKDPKRRYPHASDMADDLRRFVNDLPIQARRESTTERAVRWVRRNRVLSTVMASLVLLVAILVVSTVLIIQQRNIAQTNLVEAREQRRKADDTLKEVKKQRQLADQAAGQARLEASASREAVQRFLTAVGDVRLRNIPYMDSLRSQLLNDALVFNQQFLERSNTRGDRREASMAYLRVAQIQSMLGNDKEAGTALDEAKKVLLELDKDEPNDESTLTKIAEIESEIAEQLAVSGNYSEARNAIERAIDRYNELLPRFPTNDELRHGQLISLQRRAKLKNQIGDNKSAEQNLRDACENWELLSDEAKRSGSNRRNRATSLTMLGDLLYSTGRPDEAVVSLEQAREILEQLVGDFPNDRVYQEEYATNSSFLGAYYLKAARLGDAKSVFEDGVEVLDRLAKQFPQIPDYRASNASLLRGLATALAISGEQDLALDKFQRSAIVLESLVDDFSDSPKYRFQCAHALRMLGVHYKNSGQMDKAIEPYAKAYQMMDSLVALHSEVMAYRIDLAELAFLNSMVLFEHNPGDAEGASYAERAVQLAEQAHQVSPDETRIRHKLAKYYANLAQFRQAQSANDETESLFQKAIVHQRWLVKAVPQYEEYRRLLGISLYRLSEFYLNIDRTEDALNTIQECIQIRKENAERNPQRWDHPIETVLGEFQLARTELKREKFSLAIAAFERGIVLCTENFSVFPENDQFRVNAMLGYEELIELLLDQKQTTDAEQCVAKARAIAERELTLPRPDSRVAEAQDRILKTWQDYQAD